MEAKIGSTKTKVNHKPLALFMLDIIVYLLFRPLILRTSMKGYLKSKKIISIDLFINLLKKNSKNIDLTHFKVENPAKTIQPSIPPASIRREFRYIDSSHFLTI